MCDQYYGSAQQPGGGLYVLSDVFGTNPKIRDLLVDSTVANGRLKGQQTSGGPKRSWNVRYNGGGSVGGDETEGIWATDVTMPLTAEAIAKLGRHNTLALSDPNKDWFKIRRFWIELELVDGRKLSSDIAAATFTQPPGWPYAEGVLVPHGQDITVDLWFDVKR